MPILSPPKHRLLKTSVLLVFWLTMACQMDERKHASTPPNQQIATEAWMDQVAFALYQEQVDLPAEFSQFDKAEIIDGLMATPAFYDGMLLFNMHYLGFRSDYSGIAGGELRELYQPSYTTFSGAIAATKAVVDGGEFFRHLDPTAPIMASPNIDFFEDAENRDTGTFSAVLYEEIDRVDRELAGFEQFLTDNPDASLKELCDLVNKTEPLDLFDAGVQRAVAESMTEYGAPYPTLRGVCKIKQLPDMKPSNLIVTARTEADQAIEAILALNKTRYAPERFVEIRPLNVDALSMPLVEQQRISMIWFWNALENSSTNMNRKRASYVLKRFFCDDLTPIGIELTENHSEDAHGSDPGCQSCHYKLDPLAGYFRYHGYIGINYENESKLTFDDFAATPTESYFKQWRFNDGRWNVGYARSATAPVESMENPQLIDLTRLIGSAPEVEACLVKTIFHYLVGETVALDADYHSSLTSDFRRVRAESTSGDAVRATMKTILLSDSFKVEDPVAGVCYDQASGESASSVPCEVAGLFNQHCVNCHRGGDSATSLDLSSWVTAEGFPHRQNGQAIEKKASLGIILDRLSHPDPALRMPPQKVMPERDRETLYLWVTDQMEASP